MRSRLVHVLLLLAAVVAAGGAGYWVMVVRPLQVEIARPEQNVRAAVFGLGTIEARVQSKVGFEVAGILVELNADHGDFVRAGVVLARLQRFKQEARVGKARAGMLNAEAALSRAEAFCTAPGARRAFWPGRGTEVMRSRSAAKWS